MKAYFVVLFLCVGAFFVSLLIGSQLNAPVYAPDLRFTQTLILDAGHGGEDGGAVSANGDKESDINLAIVLRMDQMLGFCGVPAVLTRADDRSIHDASAVTLREKKVSDLHNRVALVAETDGAVLLSIHQNSYQDSRYFGAQVFYRDAPVSKSWGEATQEILRSELDQSNKRTAKPIPNTVYLMNHIDCPAILVECGFMTNREEVARLLTSDYQKKMATVLTGACLQYLQTSI